MWAGGFFGLLHCPQCFLSDSLCAEALGATRCSLHQSSNEAVATLAAALIEPRTDSLPGGSVFQSTGPPSHRLSILPPRHPNQRQQHTHTHPRLPSNPLYNSVRDTQERFPPKRTADEVPLRAKERKWDPSTWRRKDGVKEIYYGTHFVVAVWKRIYYGDKSRQNNVF